MRLALIPFCNTAPFWGGMDEAWLKQQEIVNASPKELGQAARDGLVDAGVFSLVDLWDLEDKGLFEPLADFGIAGYGRIRSILLFNAAHPRDLEGCAVGLTPQSATSVRLLELWLKRRHELKQVHWVGAGDAVQPMLLIGDQALERSLKLGAHEPRPWDLCEEWTRWTMQAFVFARIGVRKGLPNADREALLSQLEQSLDLCLSPSGLKALAQREQSRTGFPLELIIAYLSGIRYRLGEREVKGMGLFREMLSQR
jgi:predicted solute-binding protein